MKILGTQITFGLSQGWGLVSDPRVRWTISGCFDATVAATPGIAGAGAGAQDESEAVPEMSGSKRLRNGCKGATTGPCGYFLPGGHCWSVRQH